MSIQALSPQASLSLPSFERVRERAAEWSYRTSVTVVVVYLAALAVEIARTLPVA
jgi:hypothetical protein